jgi:hypothetical protein
MRLHIVALSNSRQLHAIGLQAQALQSMLSQLFCCEHGGPHESLPLASHLSPVLSVVYATKNRGNAVRNQDPLAISVTLHGSRPRPRLAAITFALFLIQLIALLDLITM